MAAFEPRTTSTVSGVNAGPRRCRISRRRAVPSAGSARQGSCRAGRTPPSNATSASISSPSESSGVVVGGVVRADQEDELPAVEPDARRVDRDVDPEALLSIGGWKLPMSISLACGAAVPTPLMPLMQMPSSFSSTMRAAARSGAGCRASSRRAGAVALRVDDRLGRAEDVLLVVRAGQRMFSAYSGQWRWNDGSSASVPRGSVAISRCHGRTSGRLARDELDALAAEAHFVRGPREEVGRGDPRYVVAPVGQDVLGLGIELRAVRCRRYAGPAGHRRVRRHVLDALALVMSRRGRRGATRGTAAPVRSIVWVSVPSSVVATVPLSRCDVVRWFGVVRGQRPSGRPRENVLGTG